MINRTLQEQRARHTAGASLVPATVVRLEVDGGAAVAGGVNVGISGNVGGN
jgi:hypothetical protein